MKRPLRLVCILVVLAFGGALGLSRPETRDATQRGDAAYEERAAALEGDRAQPERIRAAIAAYEAALAAEPDSIEVRWRLLRALYYLGDFAIVPAAAKAAAFERGRALAEETLTLVDARLGAAHGELEPWELRERASVARLAATDLAHLYFWASVHWGAWSRDAGLVATVREGVANRVHDYARVSTHYDPTIERGGAHRMLSRLHATLPRVPFISGWVDRDTALREARRALEIAPADSGNRFLFAITLLELTPERADEARTLLAEVAATPLRSRLFVEDLSVREAARERLDAIE